MDNKSKASNNTRPSTGQGEGQENVPESNTGAATVQRSAWRRLLGKKWAYPALYIAAVAIILSIMWAFQGADRQPLIDPVTDQGISSNEVAPGEELDGESLPVVANSEDMQWPVANFNEIEILVPFFDAEASEEAQQAATIQYDNTFRASLGMSLARQDNEPFDVLAAMGGVVTLVNTHPLNGQQVEITHEDGYKTVYQSLSDVTVLLHEEVAQGDVIAQAGRNEIGKDLGVHLHFEVYQDGTAINPSTLINGM